MTHHLTTTIEHVPTELGQQGYARLNLLDNGEVISFENFSVQYPTSQEGSNARQSLAFQLYYNPLYVQYRDALYYMAFPNGE